ncbi:hypothetical protein D1093_00175 [Bartonella kosoyi]|uniref:Lipoprotein n=1 Tax=Bartonella kosoyi TaxID=2133959 RepID=A0A5B9CUE5_9HYPH|nr:EexN family lipoprotein [Bartonella kosoyi]QEE08104.1 hypothetical protein D1093_00175 [Bartonella kosoyi]
MNKIIIPALLLCTGLMAAGCEKTYSVAEFKKDKKLMEEWGARCGFSGTSKNCENLRVAGLELQKEYEAKAEERSRKAAEERKKSMDELMAKEKARHEKSEAEFKAKQRAKAEREAEERAKKQQDNH